MKNDNFAEYVKDLEGMERIELILDLLVDKKITKDQAIVLIANDKQIKDKDVEMVKGNEYPYWNTPYWSTPGTGGGIIPNPPATITSNPYTVTCGNTTTSAPYPSTLT